MSKKNRLKKLVLMGYMVGLLTTTFSEEYQAKDGVKIENTDDDHAYKIYNEAKVLDSSSIYFGPSEEYDTICYLNKNDKVSVIGKSIDNWVIIKYKDNYGFIESTKLSLNGTRIPQEYLANNRYTAVEARTNVNIRKKDDINSERLTLLLKGEKLPLLADMENGWLKVEYNNEDAYVRKEFVFETIEEEIANKYYKVICLKKDSELLDNVNGNKIIDLPKYECGKVFNETENYYLIETDNTIGYIKKENLLELEDRFVIVDISEQKLELYENNEVIFTSDVVTGRPHHETDMGIESVQFKQRNRTLRGRGYSSFVKYWMRINGNAEGLHDASWRSEFGGEIYKSNGSHGCVNLPTDSAAYLYDELTVGDRVIVKR